LNCLFSQLGSAPDGSDGGYFTSRDYEDLLKYANERNIEIIPSVNMAGKSRAAIKSMLVHTASSRDASMMLQDPADDFRYSYLPNSHTVVDLYFQVKIFFLQWQ
jgi:hexosaminidase